jgi:Protein of unknown function (DUF3426)
MVREQLDASGGWVRCGHCMDVFDAKSQFSELDLSYPHGQLDLTSSHASERNLSFVTKAQKQAFWTSGVVRACLYFVSALLLALLLLQIARTQHGIIARNWPTLGVITQTVCQYAHCPAAATATRQIDAWFIENSSFQKEGAHAFRLSLQLKNTAPTQLLIPSIELSLLSGSDALLVRHVITPQPSEKGETAMDGNAERLFSFLITPKSNQLVSAEAISGYRLVLFYP